VPDKDVEQVYELLMEGRKIGQIRSWLRHNGNIVIDYVIQIEVEIDGGIYTVRRYDCAHGQPHCDIYDQRGNHRKIWINGMTRKEAWDAAAIESRTHGVAWASQFLELFS